MNDLQIHMPSGTIRESFGDFKKMKFPDGYYRPVIETKESVQVIDPRSFILNRKGDILYSPHYEGRDLMMEPEMVKWLSKNKHWVNPINVRK